MTKNLLPIFLYLISFLRFSFLQRHRSTEKVNVKKIPPHVKHYVHTENDTLTYVLKKFRHEGKSVQYRLKDYVAKMPTSEKRQSRAETQ